MTEIPRSAEAEAFLITVDAAAPEAVSACDGWTTHEIAAHVAGIAVEVSRHLEPYLYGDPAAVIPWTGRRMAVAKFVPHLRNEHALHRWDVAGEDELSRRLLGSEDLVDHSVGELGEILLVAGRQHDPDPDTDFAVRLRSPGSRDLRVVVRAGSARLGWADDDLDEPYVELDAAARHVFIWGRRPDRHGRIRSHLPAPQLARLQSLLSGY